MIGVEGRSLLLPGGYCRCQLTGGYSPRRSRKEGLGSTWTPKVCRIMALMAVIMGLGPLLYILLGFR